MKYLKITVGLFALIIGLYACGIRTENPKPSFQSKDTIAATEADTAPATTNESHNNVPIDDPIFDRLEVRCKEIESLYHKTLLFRSPKLGINFYGCTLRCPLSL